MEGHSYAVEGNIVVSMAIELFRLLLDKGLVELESAVMQISLAMISIELISCDLQCEQSPKRPGAWSSRQ